VGLFKKERTMIQRATEAAKKSINVSLVIATIALVVGVLSLLMVVRHA
jgi:hypothetical protein